MTGTHVGDQHTASRAVDDAATALVEALASAGHDGPVLVVADNPAIARSGPAWAAAFAARGWRHRVRLSSGIDGDAATLAAELQALAREARGLRAKVIVGVGGTDTCAAARAAAAIAGLPAVLSAALPGD